MQQQAPITHLDQRRQLASTTQQQVMESLQWSEKKYCLHKYRAGLEYLHVYTQGDASAIDWLERQKLFWNWWKNHWTLREEEYLAAAAKLKHRVNREVLYMGMNNPQALAREITPNGVLLGDSYAQMIGQLVKK